MVGKGNQFTPPDTPAYFCTPSYKPFYTFIHPSMYLHLPPSYTCTCNSMHLSDLHTPLYTLHILLYTSVYLCLSLCPSTHLHAPSYTSMHLPYLQSHICIPLHVPPHTFPHPPHTSHAPLHTSVTLFAPLHISACLYIVLCIPLYTLCPPPHTPLSTSLHLHTPLHAPL